VKVDVPEPLGVPEITPVVAASVSPAGRLPELIFHVYPGVPPAAWSAAEYVIPPVPEGSTAEVMLSGEADATRAIEAFAVAVWTVVLESLTATTNG